MSSANSPPTPAPLHVIYAQHDLMAALDGEGQGVNKPVVRKRRIIEALEEVAHKQHTQEGGGGGDGDTSAPHLTFHALTEPAASLKVAERIHHPQLVSLFATGFQRWADLGDGNRDLYFSAAGRVDPPDWSELVPSQVAPRDPYQRPALNNVHSEVNYFAQDQMTPLTKDTSAILHHDMAVTLKAVEVVIKGEHRQVYACTTQPGHHSGPESYGGYCYINMAALATALLQEKLGKVALLDVDYHAGNGSMTIFYRNPSVLFASLHADPEIEYPYCCGFADQVGEGPGEGSTINIPLPKGTTWEQYSVELRKVIDRIREFDAKAVVVSLGVDTIADDPEAAPLAGFKLSPEDYTRMGDMIREVGVPIIWVQEGGYKLDEAGDVVRRVLVGNLPEES